MRSKLVLLIISLALTVHFSSSASAAGNTSKLKYKSFTEDFSPTNRNPSNIGAWSYNKIDLGTVDHNNGIGFVEKTADGKYAVQLPQFVNWDNSHPSFGTHERSSPFTGNYLTKGVVSLSFETRILNNLQYPGERPITLLLRGEDGFTLYKTMYYCEPKGGGINCPNVPNLPTNWTTYKFSIPQTLAEAEQERWGVYNLKEHGISYKLKDIVKDKDPNNQKDLFESVMSDVQKVDFLYGAPRLVYGLQYYVIDATNVTITTSEKHHH